MVAKKKTAIKKKSPKTTKAPTAKVVYNNRRKGVVLEDSNG